MIKITKFSMNKNVKDDGKIDKSKNVDDANDDAEQPSSVEKKIFRLVFIVFLCTIVFVTAAVLAAMFIRPSPEQSTAPTAAPTVEPEPTLEPTRIKSFSEPTQPIDGEDIVIQEPVLCPGGSVVTGLDFVARESVAHDNFHAEYKDIIIQCSKNSTGNNNNHNNLRHGRNAQRDSEYDVLSGTAGEPSYDAFQYELEPIFLYDYYGDFFTGPSYLSDLCSGMENALAIHSCSRPQTLSTVFFLSSDYVDGAVDSGFMTETGETLYGFTFDVDGPITVYEHYMGYQEYVGTNTYLDTTIHTLGGGPSLPHTYKAFRTKPVSCSEHGGISTVRSQAKRSLENFSSSDVLIRAEVECVDSTVSATIPEMSHDLGTYTDSIHCGNDEQIIGVQAYLVDDRFDRLASFRLVCG